MNELYLNAAHDILIDSEHFVRISGEDNKEVLKRAIAQEILCMLKTEQDEAFTDYSYGIPWLNEIMELPVSYLDVAIKIIKEKISKINGVSEIVALNLKVDGRKIGGSIKVKVTNNDIVQENF